MNHEGNSADDRSARGVEARESMGEAFAETVLNIVGDGVYCLDLEGHFVAVNDTIMSVTGYDREELLGAHVSIVLDRDDVRKTGHVVDELLAGVRDVGVVELEVTTRDGRTVPVEARIGLFRSDGALRGTVGVVRDVSKRRRREELLGRRQDDLRELERLIDVRRSIGRGLVGATTREGIETAVVERLADVEGIVGAVIATPDNTTDELSIRAWAGIDPVDAVGFGQTRRESLETDATSHSETDSSHPAVDDDARDETGTGHPSPAERAAFEESVVRLRFDAHDGRWETDGTSVSPRLGTTPLQLETDSSDPVAAIALVPLRENDRTPDVLGIYAADARRFDDATVWSELGRTIGYAMRSVRLHRLLYAETVIELEFRSAAPQLPFNVLSEHADCRLVHEYLVPVDDEVVLFYARSGDADEAQLQAAVDEHEGIDRVRRLDPDHRNERLYELRIRSSKLVGVFERYGAKVTRAVTDRGESHFTVEVAPGVDVGALVDALTTAYPKTELLAKRELDREPTVVSHAGLGEALTDRQIEVLEAAFEAGYFDWPTRGSTAEELADALGIAPQTLHQHIRVAEHKVFSAFFDRE